MTALTLDQICQSGGGEFSYVFHVGGLDWAATNDSRLIQALKLDDVDPVSATQAELNAIEMREHLFGLGYKNGDYTPSNYVQILKNLDDNLGSQTIDFDEKKGIDVGNFRTSVFGGPHGYTWIWDSNIDCFGVMGLDVVPSLKSNGVISGVMSRDYKPDETVDGWSGELYWWADTDEGLRKKINSKKAAGEEMFLWVGNSCLSVYSNSVITTGDEYYVTCYNQNWNTPNERIFRNNINGLETLRITNVPQMLRGATAKLFMIHWDHDMNKQFNAVTKGTTAPTSLQVPILARSGKVASGFTESSNSWTVSVNGWTDQLREKIPTGKLEAHLKGFSFNKYTPLAGSVFDINGVYQAPHIYLREFSVDYPGETNTLEERDIWLDDGGSPLASGDYLYYDTIEELREAALTSIKNQTGLNCSYSLDESGDLVFEQKGASIDLTTVKLAGVVPWVLGWGYVNERQEEEVETDCKRRAPKWAWDRGLRKDVDIYAWTDSDYAITNNVADPNPKVKWWLHLRNIASETFKDVRIERVTASSGSEYPSGSGKYWKADDAQIDVVKNKSKCAYFYQYDYNAYNSAYISEKYWVVPYDPTKSDRFLNLTYDSNLAYTEIGSGLSVGIPGKKKRFKGILTDKDEDLGSDQSIELKFIDNEGNVFLGSIGRTGGGAAWGPMRTQPSLYWCPKVLESDPYIITDNSKPTTDTPSDIFKTLLGLQTGGLDDIGWRHRVTTIVDLFGPDSNKDRELIDWDSFDRLANGTNIEVDHFTINLKDDDIDLTVFDLLWNVCITLGIKICYEYQESQRAKVLTFKPFKGESVAQISAQTKYVNEINIDAEQTPSGTGDGEWLYSAVKPEIYDEDGAKVPITVNQKNGSTDAPIYEYKDIITILKKQKNPGDVPVDFLNNLYEYTVAWSQPTWTQNLSCNIGPLARLSVGAGCLYSGSFLLDRFTGKRGVIEQPGDLISMTETFSRSGSSIELGVQINAGDRKGISPSVDVDASDVSLVGSVFTVASGGMETDYTDNIYSSPAIPLVDQAYFGCWSYNKGTGGVEQRDCGCGDYKVVIAEGESETLINTGPNRNVWYGKFSQPTATTLSAGTAQITLDSTVNFATKLAALKSSGGYFEIDFAESHDPDIQPCQLSQYGNLGDVNGVIGSGFEWSIASGISDSTWTSATKGNDRWVAVGNGGVIATSDDDGESWTARTAAAANDFNKVIWSSVHELFITVASSGTGNRVQTSPDGETWTVRTSAADLLWVSIDEDESGNLVAVAADRGTNSVMTSSDAFAWTSQTSIDGAWRDIQYTGTEWVAISNAGTKCMRSTNRTTWSAIATLPTARNWNSLSWNGTQLLAVEYETPTTTTYVAYSIDGGLNWTEQATTGIEDRVIDHVYDPVTEMYTCIMFTGPTVQSAQSRDGLDWVGYATPQANDWRGMGVDNGVVVAVGITGSGTRAMVGTYTNTNRAIEWG